MGTGMRNPSFPCLQGRTSRGFTLIELMVGLVVGLIMVVAMSALFVSSSNARRAVERSADVIENGRYGIGLLQRELAQAGFYGTLANPTGSNAAALPCGAGAALWEDSMSLHVFGLNNDTADPGCLARKADTDAIFVQRLSTCRSGEAGCAAEDANDAYVQVSECGTEYSADPFVLAAGGSGDGVFKLLGKACAAGTLAEKRRLIRRIYFVSTDSVLSYADVRLDGTATPVALVENIEQMQVEYAVDDNLDGTADSFDSAPADWSQVIGARVWLLARSQSASRTAKEDTVFRMGDVIDPVDGTVGTYTVEKGAAYQNRRVYSSYIPFVSPRARRES